jgi:hypothetical protein
MVEMDRFSSLSTLPDYRHLVCPCCISGGWWELRLLKEMRVTYPSIGTVLHAYTKALNTGRGGIICMNLYECLSIPVDIESVFGYQSYDTAS